MGEGKQGGCGKQGKGLKEMFLGANALMSQPWGKKKGVSWGSVGKGDWEREVLQRKKTGKRKINGKGHRLKGNCLVAENCMRGKSHLSKTAETNRIK